MSTCRSLWAYRYINFLKIRQKVRFATSTFNFKNKSRISNTFPQAKMIVDVLQGAIFKISLHSTKISRSLLVKNLNSACPKRHHMSTSSWNYMSTLTCGGQTGNYTCRHVSMSTCEHMSILTHVMSSSGNFTFTISSSRAELNVVLH